MRLKMPKSKENVKKTTRLKFERSQENLKYLVTDS